MSLTCGAHTTMAAPGRFRSRCVPVSAKPEACFGALPVRASPILEAKSGLLIDSNAYSPWEFIVLPITLTLAALSGLIPSISAYRTDVAETLANG